MLQSPLLPDLLVAAPGYRLHDVEILRWGTFDGDKYHKLRLGGSSGCVTGPNRGGKSTAVDALLTLLVPPGMRHYNVAASGEGRKRERTISTYVRGAWSRTESAETGKGQSTFLRPTGVPSVLLATFKDELTSKTLTLVQFHWINANGQHEARFLFKPVDAHIPDLKLDKNQVTHRKPFEDDGWYYGTSFDEYLGKFRTILRIPDNRALRLLCSAVSMKDVTDLNEFVRTLMLDPCDPGELLDKLQSHYENLRAISEKIAQAEQEIALLGPVVVDHLEYESQTKTLDRLLEVERAGDLYFNYHHSRLLDVEIAQTRLALGTAEAEAETAKARASEARDDYLKLKQRLEANEVSQAITQYQTSKKEWAQTRSTRLAKFTEYHSLLSIIGHLGQVENSTTFNQIRQKAVTGRSSADDAYQRHSDKIAALDQRQKSLNERQDEINEELRQLGTRASKIPPRFLTVREELASALKLPEGDLPFVGELVDVAESETRWRPTIERVMHSFALSMLVAHEHYAAVSDYLEDTDPGATLVYYPAPRGSNFHLHPDASRLYGKLIIKPGIWAAAWLGGEVTRRFDHVCTEDMGNFRRETKALTLHLHGKERGARHTRYSNKEQRDKRVDYDVLGWRNADKRARLDREFNENRAALVKLRSDIDGLKAQRIQARNEELTWGKIADVVSYSDIDYLEAENSMAEIDAAIKKLTDSSNEYQALEIQVAEAETRFNELDDARSKADIKKGGIQTDLKNHETLRERIAKNLNAAARDDFPWRDYAAEIERLLEAELTLATIASQKTTAGVQLAKRITGVRETRNKLGTSISTQVARIKEICKERGFVRDIGDALLAVPALAMHHSKLVNEALPGLRSEFDEMMEHDLLKHVLALNGAITQQIDEIKQRIDEVNATLVSIDYNPCTFVRLRGSDTLDRNVANFRRFLQPCLKNQVLQTHAEIQESYRHLETLIDYIKQNRSAALAGANANNWLTFAVLEDERATGVNVMTTSDSAGDSGGQKAKLAFTILAAALCFQFRHSRERDSKAFRLVLIDEMFSKSDDENSRYALDLFTRFDFQLLLVTPMEGKARLPMPYVKTYHLVSNPTRKASAITQVTVETIEARQNELSVAESVPGGTGE